MSIVLRPYQQEAIDNIYEQFRVCDSTLLVMATGTGKTVVFSHVAQKFMNFGRVLVLAHREELVRQACRHLLNVTGREADVEMGDMHIDTASVWRNNLVVSTIQTQIAGMNGEGRMTKFKPDEYSAVILDESHHARADSDLRVLDYYKQNPKLKVLGVTATPDRGDEKALGQIFQTVAYEYEIQDAIRQGWLVPIRQQSVLVDGLDYSKCRTTAGDLNGADLRAVLEYETALHGIASPTIELTEDKKTLVFAASVGQAERLTEILNRHKPASARFVYAKTPKEERRALFDDYARGKFQYLVNVGIATEGWDEPGVEKVVMARPTKSRALYAQMAGRGTRPLSGIVDGLDTEEERREAIERSAKPYLEIIDFVGNSGRHKLITSADILGGKYSDEVIVRTKRNVEKRTGGGGEPVDVLDELEEAERELKLERQRLAEEASRQRLTIRAKYSTAAVNPFDIFDLEPWRERAWHKGRAPSAKQCDFLERSGVDISGLSFTGAQQIIKKIIENRNAGACTYKQAKVLKRFGYDPSGITFERAGELITAIANNNWRRPA